LNTQRGCVRKLKCLSEGDAMNSTLKVRTSEARTLTEKIRAEIRKRAEAKARRMLLKAPKRQIKR
jgi:vacuolar-type H+-ATPase subunit H